MKTAIKTLFGAALCVASLLTIILLSFVVFAITFTLAAIPLQFIPYAGLIASVILAAITATKVGGLLLDLLVDQTIKL